MDLFKRVLLALIIYVAAPIMVEYVKVNYIEKRAYEVPISVEQNRDNPLSPDVSVRHKQ